jgi:hypothetical protein
MSAALPKTRTNDKKKIKKRRKAKIQKKWKIKGLITMAKELRTKWDVQWKISV